MCPKENNSEHSTMISIWSERERERDWQCVHLIPTSMSPASSKCSRADVIIIVSFASLFFLLLLSRVLTIEEMSVGEEETEEKEKIFPTKANTDSIFLSAVAFSSCEGWKMRLRARPRSRRRKKQQLLAQWGELRADKRTNESMGALNTIRASEKSIFIYSSRLNAPATKKLHNE